MNYRFLLESYEIKNLKTILKKLQTMGSGDVSINGLTKNKLAQVTKIGNDLIVELIQGGRGRELFSLK